MQRAANEQAKKGNKCKNKVDRTKGKARRLVDNGKRGRHTTELELEHEAWSNMMRDLAWTREGKNDELRTQRKRCEEVQTHGSHAQVRTCTAGDSRGQSSGMNAGRDE